MLNTGRGRLTCVGPRVGLGLPVCLTSPTCDQCTTAPLRVKRNTNASTMRGKLHVPPTAHGTSGSGCMWSLKGALRPGCMKGSRASNFKKLDEWQCCSGGRSVRPAERQSGLSLSDGAEMLNCQRRRLPAPALEPTELQVRVAHIFPFIPHC